MLLVYIGIRHGSRSILHFQIDPDENIKNLSRSGSHANLYGSVTLDIRHNCMFLAYTRIKHGSRFILHFQIDPDETIEIDPDPDP